MRTLAIYLLLGPLLAILPFTLKADDKCSRLVAQLLNNHKGATYKPLNQAPLKTMVVSDNGILPGDWVVLIQKGKKSPELERLLTNSEKLLGRVQKDERGQFYITAMNLGKKARFDLPRDSKMNPVEGSFVVIDVKKSDFNDGKAPYVVIEKVLRETELDEETLHKHQISQYAVSTAHSRASKDQAKALESQARHMDAIIQAEIDRGRVDLRNLPLRSIDNITTVDYDDMIYVEKHTEGYTLYVAVSDVAHWIQKGTPLADEASKKNLTAYFDHTRYPLYPEGFERHLSLMPNEDRLAMVVKIELDQHGKRQGYEVFEAVVNNRRAWTYEEINPMWENYMNGAKTPFDLDFELYQILHQRRKGHGASYFGRKGAEFAVESQKLLRYSKQEESHELIAEFMIETNEVVGEFMRDNNLPGIYRAHEFIKGEELERIQNLATSLGIPNIKGHMSLSEVLQSTKDPIHHEILIAYVLRFTPPAYYTTNIDGHSTLASKTYMQFTSPIRRDSDTINHRIIKAFLNGEEVPYEVEELIKKADYATAKIILEKRRERLNQQAIRMKDLIASGKKQFSARIYYIGKDFVNLRIEEFDLDITFNGFELAQKGLKFQEDNFSYNAKKGNLTLGGNIRVRLDKWDSFTGEATFNPIFN